MDKIKIFDKNNIDYIELPRTKNVETSEDMVYTETEMASGKFVMDIKGFRPGFTAEWEWLPSGLLEKLLPMLRKGGFFNVEYPSSEGTIQKDLFKIETSGQKIFKFINGSPMWYGLKLTFTSQKVIKYD